MSLDRLISRFADAFGTKTAIILATVWSLLPLAFPAFQTVILYVSAGIVQLVALPLLAYQGRQATKMAEETQQVVEANTDAHHRVHRSLQVLHEHLGTGHDS